jgi:uncharacterized membrane protein
MKEAAASRAILGNALGMLLRLGTYLSSTVIAAGLVLALASNSLGMTIAAAGIALFILLPVARVAAMLFFFWRTKDYRLAAAAALVMAIVLLSYLSGSH